METDYDYMLKVTFILHTDADPSVVLDQCIEAAQSVADYCDGEADEGDVCVESIQLENS